MESNTPLKNDTPHNPPKKILLIGFGALILIVAAYGVYFYLQNKKPKVPEALTPEQEQVIMEQLNSYVEANPLPLDERTQMITGKSSGTSTKQ